MADTLQNRRDEMKDSASLSETGSDKGDNSQGNREDVFENNSGYVEERFRVDRKKLEQMLQGKKQFLRVVPVNWNYGIINCFTTKLSILCFKILSNVRFYFRNIVISINARCLWLIC